MINSILLPVDLNHESSWRKALPQAIALARAEGAGLHVLTVIPDFGMSVVGSFFPEGYSEMATQESEKALKKLVGDQVPDDIKVETHVKHGGIYKRIVETAGSLECDLIIMASHRSEMKDFLIGPNAARVVRHAEQSVFVVRE